jgi:hypothetical protein
VAIVRNYLNSLIPEDYRIADKQNIGIAGFTLDVRVRESIKMDADVPTTVLEDGSFANDHVVIKPIVLEIDGSVSDIKLQADEISELLGVPRQPVGVITKYLPDRTRSQIGKINGIIRQAQDIIQSIDPYVEDFGNLTGLFGDESISRRNTQKFFDTLEKLRQARSPIVIQMPYRTYDNMVLTTITINKDNIGEPLNYSISATEVRFTTIEATSVRNASAGTKGQTEGNTNKGRSSGASADGDPKAETFKRSIFSVPEGAVR